MKSAFVLLTIAAYSALTFTLLDFSPTTEANASKPADLVVHEWGTFTSIAGKNGIAIDWRPLNGASDLPKFVYTDTSRDGYRGTYGEKFVAGQKGNVLAKVRMETPVIYFYTPTEMDVSVNVNFPSGKITEWYPQASVVNAKYDPNRQMEGFRAGGYSSGINWGTIKLLPNEKPNYLREVSYSHYYPARETDSVPIQICNADKTKIEKEKFLFYRGVGDFGLPLSVKIDGTNLILKDLGTDEVKNIIIFENRGGKIGFKYINSVPKETITERPDTTQNLDDFIGKLTTILVDEGLYPREAKALINTWRDSWFEEGLRVFYILTRKSTDKILPLSVSPQPKEVVRVLVGRAEVITPEMEKDVKEQVTLLRSSSAKVREAARNELKKHGRFYEPILKSILESEKDEKVREQVQKLIDLS
jgi:hypothetical protein